jgi:hypothetical protein
VVRHHLGDERAVDAVPGGSIRRFLVDAGGQRQRKKHEEGQQESLHSVWFPLIA